MNDSKPMTRRQARLLMTLGVAILLTQILCTAVLIRRMERLHGAADSAQAASTDTTETTSANVSVYAESTLCPTPQVKVEPPVPSLSDEPPSVSSQRVFITEPAPEAPETAAASSQR